MFSVNNPLPPGASCAAAMDANSEGPSMALLQTANQRSLGSNTVPTG
jgi:hypothetical protein